MKLSKRILSLVLAFGLMTAMTTGVSATNNVAIDESDIIKYGEGVELDKNVVGEIYVEYNEKLGKEVKTIILDELIEIDEIARVDERLHGCQAGAMVYTILIYTSPYTMTETRSCQHGADTVDMRTYRRQVSVEQCTGCSHYLSIEHRGDYSAWVCGVGW